MIAIAKDREISRLAGDDLVAYIMKLVLPICERQTKRSGMQRQYAVDIAVDVTTAVWLSVTKAEYVRDLDHYIRHTGKMAARQACREALGRPRKRHNQIEYTGLPLDIEATQECSEERVIAKEVIDLVENLPDAEREAILQFCGLAPRNPRNRINYYRKDKALRSLRAKLELR